MVNMATTDNSERNICVIPLTGISSGHSYVDENWVDNSSALWER